MKADRIEVSRDEQAKHWVIRIQVGAEVIRRSCRESDKADKDTLRNAAIKVAADEGYEVDPANVVFS
jgi:hypothetical protein